MHSMTFQTLVLALLSFIVLGLSTPSEAFVTEQKRSISESFTVLSTVDIARLKPFTYYASASYCRPSQILAWACGQNCDANPTFRPVAAGGDGAIVQYWYVGYDPAITSIIVGHQGTEPEKIFPILTDANVEQIKLDPVLFPNLPSSIRVHRGFAREFAKTANGVLKAVQTAIQQYGVKNVTVVGHSLGAALALLDGISLQLRIPGLSVQVVGYGMPRVGNREFASYIDGAVGSVTHVTNKKDPVPILPGRFMGYHHPRGEVHVQATGSWVSCPGDDNHDKRCSVGDVPNLLVGNVNDHDGPYDGVFTRCK